MFKTKSTSGNCLLSDQLFELQLNGSVWMAVCFENKLPDLAQQVYMMTIGTYIVYQTILHLEVFMQRILEYVYFAIHLNDQHIQSF